MTLAENERNEVLSVSGINETQILQTQCRNICKLNSSRDAEDNATSRELRLIPQPAGAEGFQVAGLIHEELWPMCTDLFFLIRTSWYEA
jgi:hypothetical protein